jgi:CSLREA domain-containing protein
MSYPFTAFIRKTLGNIFFVALLFGSPLNLTPVQAGTTIIVNSTADVIADNGSCTLREAITAANSDTASGSSAGECAAGSGADIITLPAGTYTLTIAGKGEDNNATGDLDIRSDITLNGAGSDVVNSSGYLTLNGVTVRHGRATGGYPNSWGGGIYNNRGRLSIENSTLSDNWAYYAGGGVYNNYGRLNVNNSILSGNRASNGGGVNSDHGTLSIENSTLSVNSAGSDGGGMRILYGTVNINNSTLSGNSAGWGGGVYARFASVSIKNSTITDNAANSDGGGVYSSPGTLSIESSTISYNSASNGGGVHGDDTMSIENSTISFNSAVHEGGGVNNHGSSGTLSIENCTISYNTAGSNGGGVSNSFGTVEVAYSTITDNAADYNGNGYGSGGGIYRFLGAGTFKSTILSGNFAGLVYDDCGGGWFGSEGYNLVGSGTGCPSNKTGDQVTNNPQLMLLADNNGDTQTRAPLLTSPARNNIPLGENDCGLGGHRDQRGALRVGSTCDTGAYEGGGRFWDGGGSDNNWTTVENWSGNVQLQTWQAATFNSISAKDATINMNYTLVGLLITDGYEGTLTQGSSYNLTLSRYFGQSGGTFTGGGGTVDVNGDFDLSGGTFSAPSGGLSVSGDWNQSGGAFTHNDSTVTLDGSGAQTISSAAAFYDLTVNNSSASENVDASGSTLVVDNLLNIQDGALLSASDYHNVQIAAAGALELSGDITVSGNWILANGGLFVHNGHGVTFDGSGTQELDADAIAFSDLTVNSGVTLVDLDEVTVDGTLTNNGALQQTREINGNPIAFLNIKNSGSSEDKYLGLEIDPGTGNVGSTTVTIRGNQLCPGAISGVMRCFEIDPTTPQTSTVKFYYTEAERNGEPNSLMKVYRWNGSSWELEDGTYSRGGAWDAQWVQITGVDEYSLFMLSETNNTAPVAVGDTYSTNEGTNLTVPPPGVLGNDSDVDGDPLTAVLDTSPSGGSIYLNLDGSFAYFLSANFCGSDSFSYHANDGVDDSNIVTVTITVTCVNDPPVADDDTATTAEDTPATIDVLANDTDVDVVDALTVDSVTQPSNGTVINNGSDVTYTPNANFNGADSFTYTASDGNGGSDTATVNVTITPVNDPTTSTGSTYTLQADTSQAITLAGADVETALANLTFTEVDPSHGTLSGTAPNLTYTPDAGFSGDDSFTFTVTDRGDPDGCTSSPPACSAALTSPATTVTFHVEAAVPVLTTINPASETVGSSGVTLSLTGSGFVSTSQVKWNETTNLATTYVNAQHLTAIIPASLLETVQTAQVTVYTPTPGGGTSSVLAFFVTEEDAGVIDQDVASGTDPSVTSGSETATAEGEGLLAVAEYDANPGGTPSFSASGTYFDVYAAPDSTFTQVTIQACSLSISDKLYWWNTVSGQWEKASPQSFDAGCVTLTVTDASSPSISDLSGTAFTPGNNAPEADAGGPYSGDEGSPISLDGTGSSDPEEDSLTYAWSMNSILCAFDDATSARPVLTCADNDDFTVTLEVSDGGLIDSGTANVSVANVTPQVTVDIADQPCQYSDEICDVTFSATDVAADTLTNSTSSLPDTLSLGTKSCEASGIWQTCTWTLAGTLDKPAGSYLTTVTITDKDGGSDSAATTVTVVHEDADIWLDNENTWQVEEPEGNSGPFSLFAYVKETTPDTATDCGAPDPGDIDNAEVSMTLAAVGPGESYLDIPCTPVEVIGGVLKVQCDFDDVAVNTYHVQATVAGDYYVSGMAEDVLVVYDPSLGFTTGSTGRTLRMPLAAIRETRPTLATP